MIYAYQAHLEVDGCTVRDTRQGYQGAITLTTSTAFVTNSTFTRLYMLFSPAIFVYLGSWLTVASSSFHDNEASTYASAIHTCALSKLSLSRLRL